MVCCPLLVKSLLPPQASPLRSNTAVAQAHQVPLGSSGGQGRREGALRGSRLHERQWDTRVFSCCLSALRGNAPP